MKIEVRALGPITLEVDGVPAVLSPSVARLLALLVAADGLPVTVSSLHRELWPTSLDPTHRRRESRTDVQKRIHHLRRALDPLETGETGEVLRTERVVSGAVPETAYRLVLDAEKLDCARFEELVKKAMTEARAAAAATLAEALSLWSGPPLAEARDAPFAQARVRRLEALYETARGELIQIRIELGQLDAALALAESIAARRPDDPEAAGRVAVVRERLRERRGDQVLRREFPRLRATLAVVGGDLFEQRDANLVVGFTDTFDTSTQRNELISAQSVQGQLLHRLYGGDASLLDRELSRGLRRVVPVARESQRDKPKGKRLRYPLGTVVPLPQDERWIFAVAYAQQGNDLRGRSSPRELRYSLECLWRTVAVRGQLRPVAIPLVGSGLARIPELSRPQLAAMIIETFAAEQRDQGSVSPELRIVIRSQDTDDADLRDLTRLIESLDQDGRPDSD